MLVLNTPTVVSRRSNVCKLLQTLNATRAVKPKCHAASGTESATLLSVVRPLQALVLHDHRLEISKALQRTMQIAFRGRHMMNSLILWTIRVSMHSPCHSHHPVAANHHRLVSIWLLSYCQSQLTFNSAHARNQTLPTDPTRSTKGRRSVLLLRLVM